MKNIFKVLFVGMALMSAPVFAADPMSEEKEYDKNSKLLTEAQDLDIVYGDEDAPVTIIEYASLSCSHCANFHKTVMPSLKKKYFDTGKAKLIYRHYPLNPPALRAAQIVECVDTLEKKHKFVDALFKSQSEWAYKNSEKDFLDKIKLLADIGGISSERFDACTSDKDLEDKVLAGQLKAGQELQVSSTPSVFINSEKFVGAKTVEAMSAAIDLALDAQ